ncbi:TerC family protein [Sediminibacillus albus]|uniref:Integral membrane protein, YkoY family n=1 Tax=Sediminibacillus albus TaxID=407036 RepID=A0A1G8VRI8_9BACI|nr:TerC family protein [Sediminibacillus albus]SDJ68642.1 integral membrane protein, YkoY family [Sediminibacillus albus]
MSTSILLEYGWTLLALIGLEGLLAADNALVMALIVKHLPQEKQRKALLYGLGGAFIFRFGSLFFISFLIDIWQVQALGAIYLLFISINNLLKIYFKKEPKEGQVLKANKQSGFWVTVIKVELADIAFAVDSILAAVALATTLPETPAPLIGDMDGAQFAIIIAGGMIGLILIRIAASYIVRLLKKKPALETAAYLIVGWVAVKLAIHTLAHPSLAILPQHFPESPLWKTTFWAVMAGFALIGWFWQPGDKHKR